MEDFEAFQTGNGDPFPSTDFINDVTAFSATDEGQTALNQGYLGLIDGEVRFSMIEVAVHGKPWRPHSEMNPEYERWLEIMDDYNDGSGDGLDKGKATGGDYYTWMASEREFVRSAI